MLRAERFLIKIRIVGGEGVGKLQGTNRLEDFSVRIERKLPFCRRILPDLLKIGSRGITDAAPPIRIRVQLIRPGLERREPPFLV